MRRIGFILFGLSWVLPWPSFERDGVEWQFWTGLGIFLFAILGFYGLLVQDPGWREIVTATGLGIGLLSNLGVFFRFPRHVSWFAVIAPWLVPALALSEHVESPSRALSVPPFFPWAVGLSLIHLSIYFAPTDSFDRWMSEF